MKFRVEIDLGNAAFDDVAGNEIARILRQLAEEMQDVSAHPFFTYVRDFNGNRCGRVEIIKE